MANLIQKPTSDEKAMGELKELIEPRRAMTTPAPERHAPPPRISVVMNTLNEAGNIANAIKSVKSWVSEVIVMDMESDDDTPVIAKTLGAKVFQVPRVVNFNFSWVPGVERATGEWILVLDADELIPLELSKRLLRLAQTDEADVCEIPRLNYFSGAPLKHAGWGPTQDQYVRFFKRASIRFSDRLHLPNQALPNARVVRMNYDPDVCIVHFCYKDSTQFVTKLNRYTTTGALERRNTKSSRDKSIVLAPVMAFLNRYLRKGGYLSGWRGFYYSFMMAVYRMTQAVKIREFQAGCDSSGSTEYYQRIADKIISQYQTDGKAR